MILPNRSDIDLILGWSFLGPSGVMQLNRRLLTLLPDPKTEEGVSIYLPTPPNEVQSFQNAHWLTSVV